MAKTKVETAANDNPWADFEVDEGQPSNNFSDLDEGAEEEEEDPEEEQEELEELPKPEDKKKKTVKETPKPVKKIEKVEAPAEALEEPEEAEEQKESEDVDPSSFYTEVEKLTGQEVAVEYGEVDPLTPQGVAIREKAVRESALESFLEEIESKFPVAYKALQHAYNGGNVADLFSVTTGRDYSKVDIGDKDDALATEILKEYYRSKGVKNDKKLAQLIETDQDSDLGIVGEAKAALSELQAEQASKTNDVLEQQRVKSAEEKKRDQIMVSAIDEVLESGKVANFKIPSRQEAQEFKKYALQNIRKLGEGKYEFATPIEPGNLEKLLQYQYFQFKKGDLEKLIAIKASSKAAENMRLKFKAEQEKTKSGAAGVTKSSSLSLRDF